MPPSTSTPLISAMTSRSVPRGKGDPQPVRGHRFNPRLEAGRVQQCAGPVRARSIRSAARPTTPPAGRRSPLADDLAPVDDGHGVAGPLDLVEKMGGQHDGAAFGHQGQDHVAHVLHPGRVETVHRLVQDQQLGISDQARGDTETLTHAHRVLRHFVIGAMSMPTRSRDGPMRARAAGSRAAARICRFCLPVRWPWNRGSSTMAPTRANAAIAMARDGIAEQRHRAGVGVRQSEQHPDQRGLPRAVRSRDSRTRSPGERGARHRRRRRCP